MNDFLPPLPRYFGGEGRGEGANGQTIIAFSRVFWRSGNARTVPGRLAPPSPRPSPRSTGGRGGKCTGNENFLQKSFTALPLRGCGREVERARAEPFLSASGSSFTLGIPTVRVAVPALGRKPGRRHRSPSKCDCPHSGWQRQRWRCRRRAAGSWRDRCPRPTVTLPWASPSPRATVTGTEPSLGVSTSGGLTVIVVYWPAGSCRHRQREVGVRVGRRAL